jgi:hypothetical protein
MIRLTERVVVKESEREREEKKKSSVDRGVQTTDTNDEKKKGGDFEKTRGKKN